MDWLTKEQLQADHGLSAWKVKVWQRVGRVLTERRGLEVVYRLADADDPDRWLTLTEARQLHGVRLSGGEWARLEREGRWQVRRVDEQVFVRPSVAEGVSYANQ